jgi:hypothetical protein
MILAGKRTNPRLYTADIYLKLTARQKALLRKIAAAEGVSMSAWLRRQIEAARVRMARREKP